MHATTVAVDLAKNVFKLAVADEYWRVVEQHRPTRSQFERCFANRAVDRIVMEACDSAHHWGRWLTGLGVEIRLLPLRYVRPYAKREKTDAADAAALSDQAPFASERLQRKLTRQAYPMPVLRRFPPPLARSLIAHHGPPGSPHIARCR